MDIQVRYTGSTEQFQNLSERSHLIYPSPPPNLIGNMKRENNVSINRNKTKIQKSKDNTKLKTGDVKA